MTVAVQNFLKFKYLTLIYWKTILFQSLCKVLKTNKKPQLSSTSSNLTSGREKRWENQFLKFSAKKINKISAAPAQPRKAQKTSLTQCFFECKLEKVEDPWSGFWVVEAWTVRLPVDEAGKASQQRKQHLQSRELGKSVKWSELAHREILMVLRILV